MQKRDVLVWKAIALGAVIVYLYKASKANGGTLAENPYGIKLNPDKILNFATRFVPPEYRKHASDLGRAAITRWSEGEYHE